MGKRKDLDFSKSKYASYEDMIVQVLLNLHSVEGGYNDLDLTPESFSPDFIAALLGNIQQESNLNPFAYNPNDANTGHSSSGLFQHHKEREKSLIKYMTESEGFDSERLNNLFLGLEQPTEVEIENAIRAQLVFALHYDGKDSQTLKNIVGSSSTEDLTKGFSNFERYDGYDNEKSEAYKKRKNSIFNYQNSNRSTVIDSYNTFNNILTYDNKKEIVKSGGTFDAIDGLLSNKTYSKSGVEKGLLLDEQILTINQNAMREAVRVAYNEEFFSTKKGVKFWENATAEEKQDFITSSFGEKDFQSILADQYNKVIDIYLKENGGASYDNEYLRLAAREKLFTQITNSLPQSFGSDQEKDLSSIFGVTEEDSDFYNLNFEKFTDSFVEDFLEESGSIKRLHNSLQSAGIAGADKRYRSNKLLSAKEVNEHYKKVFKNSYSKEQIAKIEEVSGQTIDQIFDNRTNQTLTTSPTTGAVSGGSYISILDLGLLATNTDRLLDAKNKLNFLQNNNIEGLPQTNTLTQEQVNLINEKFNLYAQTNEQKADEFLLSQEGIDTPYWKRPGFDEAALSDDAREKLHKDRDNIDVLVRDKKIIKLFDNPEERDTFKAKVRTEAAEQVDNEQNTNNNSQDNVVKDINDPSDQSNEKKGFWDSLGDVGDKLTKGLGFVKKITDMIGGPGTLVSAALGKQAYHDAMKEIKPLELPGLSDMFKQHLYQVQQMSKMGFTPEEAAKHRKDIDKAYNIAIENSVRGTAGDRAKFLATSGVLDAQRSTALLDFAAKDAELQRQNMEQYGHALNFKEEFEYRKTAQERSDDLAEQIRNKQGASNFAQLAFQQVADNMNDQSSIYKNMFEQMLANKIQNNSNNPLVGLNTPGSSNTTTGSVNPN